VRILTIVGTRPQLIKEAALSPTIRARHHEVLVDTGQHYDAPLAGDFFAELRLPAPDHALGVGGGSASEQVGRMLLALEPVVRSECPDLVLVYGDTNSTLAGGLAAAQAGLPLAHVEAGLRSFDRRMPEEINRVVVDHLARWCFAPTADAVANLAAEGVVDGVVLVGDLMHDLAATTLDQIRDPAILRSLEGRLLGTASRHVLAQGAYLYATVHRAQNRDPHSLASVVRLFDAVASQSRPVVLALHPGTAESLRNQGLTFGPDTHVIEPVGYRTSLTLQLHAAAVLTDSGGIQRESAWLGTPCLVLRERTEWTTVADADAVDLHLVGLDARRAASVLDAVAPRTAAPASVAERVRRVVIASSGTAQRITDTLDAGSPSQR